MSVAITSLLRDKDATILVSLALCIFTVSLQFSVSGNFHECFIVISLLSFRSKKNLDQQAIGQVARFQVAPKESHVLAVKRIFIYLKGA